MMLKLCVKNVYINREPKGVFPFLACNIYDMRLDIEKPFFDSYKKHWLSCINILEYYYNMLIEEPQHFIPVCEVSSQEVFTTNIMELKEEITANLEVCKGLEAERYVFSLIEPFKGFGEIIHKDLLTHIGRLCYEKRKLFCDWVCDILQDYELAAEAAVKLQEIAAAQGKQKKIVLSYVVGTLDRLLDVISQYSNMLDGVLLSFGVDLLQVQKINGITLINQRDLTQLSFYCGTMERALLLIKSLSQKPMIKQREKGIRAKILVEDKDTYIKDLHTKIDGKIGVSVVKILQGEIDKGFMLRPTYKEMADEFGDIGNRQGYNRAFSNVESCPKIEKFR